MIHPFVGLPLSNMGVDGFCDDLFVEDCFSRVCARPSDGVRLLDVCKQVFVRKSMSLSPNCRLFVIAGNRVECVELKDFTA